MHKQAMRGKTVLVTGATDGIGKQTALELARMGARVLLHGRSPTRAEAVRKELSEIAGPDAFDLVIADFSSLRQVRELAAHVQARYERLDVLVNNAGVMTRERQLSQDGYELAFAVNYLAPFLLTHLLLDLLKRSAPARVVNVSSMLHLRARLDFENLQGEKDFKALRAYSSSKLALVLFTLELAQRLSGSGVTVNALHPGVIDTKMLREGLGMQGEPVESGARTSVFLAASPEAASLTGQYFDNLQPQPASPLAQDQALRRRLWEISEKLCEG